LRGAKNRRLPTEVRRLFLVTNSVAGTRLKHWIGVLKDFAAIVQLTQRCLALAARDMSTVTNLPAFIICFHAATFQQILASSDAVPFHKTLT
jgi:hypothetical protein